MLTNDVVSYEQPGPVIIVSYNFSDDIVVILSIPLLDLHFLPPLFMNSAVPVIIFKLEIGKTG